MASSGNSTPSASGSAGLLKRQLKAMQSDKDIPGISCGLVNDSNFYEWEVMLMISDDVKYYGGKLRASTNALSHASLGCVTVSDRWLGQIELRSIAGLLPFGRRF